MYIDRSGNRHTPAAANTYTRQVCPHEYMALFIIFCIYMHIHEYIYGYIYIDRSGHSRNQWA